MTPEEKIADLKANFDYVLEGKEVEYREERKKLCDDFENIKAGLESQIAQLGERCNQLLKDKGNLTDELDERTKDLLNANHRIEQMQDAKCTSCTELGGMQLKINRLEQQIEKMKCPQNCKDFGDCIYSRCPCDKWQLRR